MRHQFFPYEATVEGEMRDDHAIGQSLNPRGHLFSGYLAEHLLTSAIVSKYLAAYLLLNASGAAPTADKITSVLESVGIEVEESQVTELISALEGKSVEELIAEGNEKLASVPTGGAAPAAGASAGAAAEEAAAEEEEEAKEESDDDMGFGLFD